MTRPDDRLTSPYRAIRPIAAPGDGPWPGMLTSLPSGERGVLVDAEVLGPDWAGWDAVSDGHVLAPIDVVRVPGGHEVILPVCPESLETFISRRQASTSPLARGEAVTIGVSLLRGAADLLEREAVSGQWWLTDAGRPVFATDAAALPARDGALDVFEALARAAPHPTAWADAADAVRASRVSAAELDRAELALFTIADPTPLDLAAGALRAHALPAARAAPVGEGERERTRTRHGLWQSLARHVDADMADLVSRATTSMWRRARGTERERPARRAGRERRRAPVIVGAGIAAAVLCVGLMWPEGEGSIATAESAGAPHSTAPVPASTATPAAAASADPSQDDGADAGSGSPTDGAASGAELEAAAVALLGQLDDCGDDAECTAEIVMDGVAAVLRPAAVPAERRSLVLLDDFGGIAVLRVDDSSEQVPSQLVVIALRDGTWLLRDIQDAAQQP